MKRFLCVVLVTSVCFLGYARPIKLACVGNSITAGAFIPNDFQNSYPGILMQMLGEEYDVRNFGVSGTTTLSKGNYPYISTDMYRQALEFLPDIVTIKLGTNDSKSFNWVHGSEYEKDLTNLVKSFINLPSHPKLFLCLPVPAIDYSSKSINDSTIQASIIPSIKKVAGKFGLPVIDLHEAMKSYPSLFPDHIHPTAEGSLYIASYIYREITGKEYDGKVDLDSQFPGQKSSENGFHKYVFYYHGRKASVVVPENVMSGKPWVLSSMGELSKADEKLLERGFHIVQYDGNDLNGVLHRYYGLSEKKVLESDDTVFLKNDLKDAFAVFYTGKNNAKFSVPTISLYDSDSAIEKLSGNENGEAVADFVLRNVPGYEKYQRINYRGTLHNAFLKFSKQKKGCVAFLGGSITEMDGWKNMIEEDLKHRFPDCDFQFIEAGISSLGSTAHSFRMENDVFKEGIPDLMFVEAAVNDDTNIRGQYVAQTRAMEGIVRHALSVNPYMDVVMLHFIYDPFISLFRDGRLPDVIMNHERVANWYGITSINLSSEVASRIEAGEFTWEKFGGTHPAWFGHKYYAATINTLFDKFMDENGTFISHSLPEEKLDIYSYDSGILVNVEKAEKLKGFSICPSWNNPADGGSTRERYVNVPMLVSSKVGASLELDFEGTAVGIYGVFGPGAGVIEYSVDGAPYKQLDTYTKWSSNLYLPWVYVLEDTLNPSKHKLSLKVVKGECMIFKFVIK